MEQTDDQPSNLTPRGERAAKFREEQETKRKAALALKAQYQKAAKSPVLRDLIKKIDGFGAYHLKMAKDGVGFEQIRMSDGSVEQKTVRFTPEERTGHLDRSAGIEEISNYIARQLAIDRTDDEE